MLTDLLDAALKFGITELRFWEMTVAEIQREIQGREWQIEQEEKRKAIQLHRLGELIGISVACLFDSKSSYPTLSDAYPHLFPPEEKTEQDPKWDASVARFLQFANAFNSKQKNT